MVVGCGKCPVCRNLKASSLALKCKLESRSWKYCHFITLTYDDNYVPLSAPIAVHGTKGTIYKFISICARTQEYGKVLCSIPFTERLIDELYKKLDTNHGIPYLSRRDAQLFIKRLRKNIYTYIQGLKKEHQNYKGHANIRFFIVGEYGPKHLRPHYHLLVWHSNREISERMEALVYKSWQFGRSDSQIVQRDASSYVASYVNGISSLPYLYQQGGYKPFTSHSFFLGEDFYRSKGKEIYKLSATEFIRRSEKLDGSISEFTLWRSLKDTFYPRCRDYASLSPAEREFLYTMYAKFGHRKEASRQPYKLAREILKEIDDMFYHWELPYDDLSEVAMYYDHKFRWSSYHTNYLHNVELYKQGILPDDEFITISDEYIRERQKLFGIIYRDLRLSKHFLEFVCPNDNSMQIRDSLHMIELFYKSLELAQLGDFYEIQSSALDEKIIDYDELQYFYDDDLLVTDVMNTDVYKKYIKCITKKIADRQKHKLQNDANRIHFCEVGLL